MDGAVDAVRPGAAPAGRLASPSCAWATSSSISPRARVSRDGHEISLSAKEFQLLEVFVRNPDQVLDADDAGTRIL